MSKLIDIIDIFKLIVIYLITSITSIMISHFFVKISRPLPDEFKNYLWVVIIFTIMFLTLIRLFKVNYKSVVIYLIVSMFMLLFSLLNLDTFITIARTPDKIIFPIMTNISFYTTIPFLAIIETLVGYNIGNFSYIVLPIYMLILCGLSYVAIKI